jgi:hypothetical protein
VLFFVPKLGISSEPRSGCSFSNIIVGMKKKITQTLPWVLIGISIVTISFLVFSLNSMKNDAVQQIKNLQAIEAKFQSTQTAYDTQVDILKDDLDKSQAARDVYAEQLQTAEDALACANKSQFKPDYLSDTGMSKALTEFLTTTEGGEMQTASWETLWEGSKSTMFTIILTKNKTEVGYIFIVYHNDAHFAKNRVFSLSKQCWLDG